MEIDVPPRTFMAPSRPAAIDSSAFINESPSSCSSSPDRSVYGSSAFLQFAAGASSDFCPQPELHDAQISPPDARAGTSGLAARSPEEIMQQIHTAHLQAAEDALSRLTCTAQQPWQRVMHDGQRAVPPPLTRRTQSLPPLHSYHHNLQ